jgi:hypothetical protein
MKWVLIALVLVTAACGQPPAKAGASPVGETPTPSATATATSSPGPSSSPTTSPPSKTLLFAVLEAKGTANAYTWNTVAIAGLDGYARAKTAFVPMPVPTMGCIGAIIPESAHVAAGKVYFADGKGVVRSLSVTGQVTKVATFALTSSQQMLSFAVSPDGSRLLATVFTLPAKPNVACTGTPDTGYALDVYSAPAGGASTLLYHQSLQSTPANVMALTGWDAVGPVGTSPTVWATQGGGPASQLGVAVRIDAGTGKVLRQVADPSSCQVWEVAASGDFVCIPQGSSKVNVRRPDGSEIWQFTATAPVNAIYNPFLAPDEQHVVVSGTAYDTEQVGAKDGSRVNLAGGPFGAQGWLDSRTLIGGTTGTKLAYVRLSAPRTVVSLGFAGLFVGAVQN